MGTLPEHDRDSLPKEGTANRYRITKQVRELISHGAHE